MMDNTKKIHWTIFSLLVTIVIDIMGMGLVFPLLPELFLSDHPLLISEFSSVATRNMMYGFSMAAWSAGLFFGTPYIGDLSDKMGRKQAILWCLGATSLGYLLAVFSILQGSAMLFIISRFIVGFFGGAFSVAQAVISDISPPAEIMKNMSWISLAASLGFIVGPLISMVMSSPVISQLGPVPIFTVAAVFPLINLAWFYFLFKETYVPSQIIHLNLTKAFTAFTAVFIDQRTKLLMMSFFLFELAWGFYVQSISLVLESLYGLDTQLISAFFILMGFGFVVGIFITQPRLVKILSISGVAIFSCIFSGLVLLLGVLYGGLAILCCASFIFCVFELSAFTGYSTLSSNAVTESEQGKVMGGIGALFGGAFTCNALLIGPISAINPVLVLIMSGILMMSSGLSLAWLRRN